MNNQADTIDLNREKTLISSLNRTMYFFIKRLFDVLMAIIGIIAMIPIALIVKVSYMLTGDFDSIFYKQKRIGKNGKIIYIYKFRSMIPNADEVLKELNEKREAKGLKKRNYRALIIGIPNVGKSTLINRLAGKKVVGVGNKPGVTKQLSWIRISKDVDLMDSPGILWPKIDDEKVGLNLACFSAIKEEILPIDEVACYILKYMFINYKENLKERYGLENIDFEDFTDAYEVIGRKRGCILRGNEVDYDKVSALIVRDLNEGHLGKVTFDE